MFDKLREVEGRYEEIQQRLCDPGVVSDVEEYTRLMKESKSLLPVVEKYREYRQAEQTAAEAKALLDEGGLDKELRELAEQEWEQGRRDMEHCAEELKILLLPRDENDDRNVIIEIRGGAGGEESALFAGSLYRMYTMYAESRGFKVEVIDANETELGGYKEIRFAVSGEGAYSRLKFESGVHRVQRVPETEAGIRIRPCGCCAPACTSANCRSSSPPLPPTGGPRWAPATAVSASAPTIFLRGASPITASV